MTMCMLPIKKVASLASLAAVVGVGQPAFAQDGSTAIGVPQESSPAPAAQAPPPSPAPAASAPPPYVAEAAPAPRWPQRNGFTLDLGLGPAYTTVSKSAHEGGFGVGGLSLSIGGFVSRRLAIAARFAGTTFFEDVPVARVSGVNVVRSNESQAFVAAFYGPVLQVFVSDHVFLSGGAGLGVLMPSYFSFDRDGASLPKPKAGFAMNGRAGFGFLARAHHWLGVVLELTPGFYGDNGTTFGSAALLQWQYY